MEVRQQGYKPTEFGLIPEEWEIRPLGEIFTLKHGFPFPSEYFSNSGPIVLTPGNFRLEGGLYFEQRNTKRYSGSYSPEMSFNRGDLLIVMTDLTPSCNLLGKPAIVDTEEIVLHNQRIGKVVLKGRSVFQQFLFYVLLSRRYLDHIKEQAFGSTVRHTSNKSIYSAQLAWPTYAEQRAIATALSDVDALLDGLTRLIAKKRDLKQATIQQLLTGQTRLPGFNGEWKHGLLGDLADLLKGNGLSKGQITHLGTRPCILYGELFTTYSRVIERVASRTDSDDGCISKCGDVVMPGSTTTSGIDLAIASALLKDGVALGGDINVIRQRGNDYDPVFLANYLTSVKRKEISELTQGITIHHLYGRDLRTLALKLPSLPEQKAIASILSDMDAELAALDARLTKTRALKQAMMSELLTGKTRLPTA